MRVVVAVLIAFAVAGCVSKLDSPPANPQGVINERVAIMKGFGGALGASSAYVQGKGTAQAARAKLGPAMQNTGKLAGLFPRGTAMGDKGAGTSRALSTIFSNRADFEAKIDATARALGALDALVARGAKAEASAAFDRARAACGACHTKYRAADE